MYIFYSYSYSKWLFPEYRTDEGEKLEDLLNGLIYMETTMGGGIQYNNYIPTYAFI